MKTSSWRSTLFQHSPVASELGQAKVRILNVSPVCLYLIAAWHFQWQPVSGAIAIGAAGYIGYTIAWLFIVASEQFGSTARRVMAAVLDQALPAYGMYLGGFLAAYVVWVPALGSLGSGLRFGTRYSWISSLAGAPLMCAAFYFSAEWRSIPEVAAGVVIANFFIPLYAVILVKRLEQENQALLARTAHLEHVNRHDSLTGLLNRIGFLDALAALDARVQRDNGKAAVMILDLDGFKEINDTFGHEAGDKVLKAVALALKGALRSRDSVARLGGDEFAIVLDAVGGRRDVETVASNILAAVRATALPESGLALSASIGACVLPHPALAATDAMIAAADRQMYEAKSRGKNRACILD